jgi:hypothetical protein
MIFDMAKAVPIQDEIARRGIRLVGRGAERCGACPRCGGRKLECFRGSVLALTVRTIGIGAKLTIKENDWWTRDCRGSMPVIQHNRHFMSVPPSTPRGVKKLLPRLWMVNGSFKSIFSFVIHWLLPDTLQFPGGFPLAHTIHLSTRDAAVRLSIGAQAR